MNRNTCPYIYNVCVFVIQPCKKFFWLMLVQMYCNTQENNAETYTINIVLFIFAFQCVYWILQKTHINVLKIQHLLK